MLKERKVRLWWSEFVQHCTLLSVIVPIAPIISDTALNSIIYEA